MNLNEFSTLLSLGSCGRSCGVCQARRRPFCRMDFHFSQIGGTQRDLPILSTLTINHSQATNQAPTGLYRYVSMVRWCSFCQSFMGESPPYSDFSWTDGICVACKSSGN